MRNPKPVLSSSKNFFGILHFEVSVCSRGQLYLGAPFIPRKRYDNNRSLGPFIDCTVFYPAGLDDAWVYSDRCSLMDMGIDLNGAYDNQHRTFRYNVNSYEFFRRMVDAQDLEGYLALINAKVDVEDIRKPWYVFDTVFYEDADDNEPNPFNVGDKVMLNGVDDKTLMELGFKKRKHYTIKNIHHKDSGLIQVDDKNASPALDSYAHHRFFKLVRVKETV